MNSTICIAGAGSIGCFVGGKLLNSGHQVIFYGRPRMQDELLNHGMHLTDLSNQKISIPKEKISYFTDPKDLSDFSILIITVKSKDTHELIRSLQHKLNSKSQVVLSFQNGVRNPETIRSILSSVTVLGGMVPFNVVSQGNGKFHSGTSGDLVLENKENISAQIKKIFSDSGLPIKLVSNFTGTAWGKLIFNLNNALNALAGIPLQKELQDRDYRKILSMCMKEALAVLKKSDIRPVGSGTMIPSIAPHILRLPDFLFFRIASQMLKIDPLARSSMWEDLAQGRETEIDFLNGEIVRLGEKYQFPTPMNSRIVNLIKKAEQEKKGSPNLSPKAILEF